MLASAIRAILQASKIHLIDIGASGGLEPRWRELDEQIIAYLFEPDRTAYEDLIRGKNTQARKYFNIGLWDAAGSIPYHVCRKQTVSSNYVPNIELLNLFDDAPRCEVLRTVSIDVDTLDHCIPEVDAANVDFLKIDTQGSELKIIQGGRKLLQGAVIGLEVEVEFAEIYVDQPLFGDVHAELIQLGFDYMDFVNLVRWDSGSVPRRGQLAFGEAVFIKTPERFLKCLVFYELEAARSKVRRYLAVALVYRKFDLVERALTIFERFVEVSERARIRKQIEAFRRADARKDALLRAMFRICSKLLYDDRYDYVPLLKR
jgi:FkbM family methyltransferase